MNCKGGCTSNLLSYEDAVKWIETGEYDRTLTYIDGQYVSPPSNSESPNNSLSNSISTSKPSKPSNDSTPSQKYGSCKKLQGVYAYQGVKITDCEYSSSKGKISITIDNNSGYDLGYIEVDVYSLDENGKTIDSKYTNHGSTIRDGASQTLETYVDDAYSFEVEISNATVKR